MSLSFALATLVEFIVGGFIIWGAFNEGKLADFEQKLFSALKKKIKTSKAQAFKVHNSGSRHCA